MVSIGSFIVGYLLGALVSELTARKLRRKLDEVKRMLADIEAKDHGLGAKVKSKRDH
jgi:hypothetical protein